jgi:hypothetical protein
MVENKNLTINLRMQELQRCKEDPIHFIKNYIYIQHPVRGRIPLELYPFQEDCISDFLEYKYNIVVKSRQLGLSTITSAYCLWLAMFHEDKDIRLMATRLDTAKNMIQKIGIAFKDVPAWIKTSLGITKTEKESVKYIAFTNGSKIEAIPTTPESVRGIACSLLVIDECVSGETLVTVKNKDTGEVLETCIQKLYFEIGKINTKFEVLTPSGWSNFTGIKKTKKQSYLVVTTRNSEIRCSYEHKLKFPNGEFLEAQFLVVGDELLEVGEVLSVKEVIEEIELYDLLNVEFNNEYYTNGFVSSNCAHIEKFDDIWEAARPTITTGGDAILFSSPNGKGLFYEIYKNSEIGDWEQNRAGFHGVGVGKNGFHGIKLPWQVHPERDDAWFENETKSMDAKKIDKEYCCGFEGSGNTFFDSETITWVKSTITTPIFHEYKTGDFWIWATPESSHKYIISSDISRGDGDDYSCCHIVDTTVDEQVAEFYGKIPPDKFADLMVLYALKYNNALIINELNSIGIAASIRLRDSKYPNLYYDEKIRSNLSIMTDEEKESVYPGYTTSSKSREKLLAKLENALRNKQIKINSHRFANEMDTFVWNGKKAQSLRTKNDDAIMALSIALLEYEPSGVSKNKDTSSSMDWHNAFLRSISRGNQGNNIQKVTEVEKAKLQSEILGDGNKNAVSVSPYSSYRRPNNGFGFFGLDPRKLIK